ncbi:MAG: phosphate acyltransferase PlsX [Candidatus Aminicenantes bacterium]|nr:phosphate acyltransferase PlsX [Candidatus Aminicenantes bacterium]MDH5714162.1 phosphate acyltransferase PlsX [Candidatus Aminicenantes bacterium]
MKIAVDAMGGDFAPRNPVEGSVQAAREFDINVVLVGRQQEIKKELQRLKVSQNLPIEIISAEDVVDMSSKASSVLKKKSSSIMVASSLVKEGRAQGIVSAGNTGATMAAAKFVIGCLQGVDRPALAMVIPTPKGSAVLLDVGANVDCKPQHLTHFAIMGYIYAKRILNIPEPKIGLLSIGEEESKGNEVTREAYQMLKNSPLSFYGNIEGTDVFSGKVDVIVCDGFVGNITLKVSESIAATMQSILKEEMGKNFVSKLAYPLRRQVFVRFQKLTDYSEYAGAPLLGIKETCIICHGRSSPKAIKNAIKIAADFYQNRVNQRIKEQILSLTSPKELH